MRELGVQQEESTSEDGKINKQVYEFHNQLHYSAEETHLVLNTTPSLSLVLPDPHELTLAEEGNVANMQVTGCGCSLGKDGQCCCRQFRADYIMAV